MLTQMFIYKSACGRYNPMYVLITILCTDVNGTTEQRVVDKKYNTIYRSKSNYGTACNLADNIKRQTVTLAQIAEFLVLWSGVGQSVS